MDTSQHEDGCTIREILSCICSLWMQYTADPETTIHIHTDKVTIHGLCAHSESWPDTSNLDELRKNAKSTTTDGLLLRWLPRMESSDLQVLYCGITDTLYIVFEYPPGRLNVMPLSRFMEADPKNTHPAYLECMDALVKGHDFLLKVARSIYNEITEQEFEKATLN